MFKLRVDQYVALKIYVRSRAKPNTINREIKIYQHIASIESSHPGRQGVRTILDSFQIAGPDGIHTCLVHEPLWESLENIQRNRLEPKLSKNLLRFVLTDLLQTLDFLHSECHVIHTGKCDPGVTPLQWNRC